MRTFLLSSVSLFVLLLHTHTALAAFSDIQNHTHADAILYVKQNGIVEGYADGTYKPNAAINRAEFTKIIVESRHDSTEINGCATASIGLSDVPASAWFAKYVCAAKSHNIIGGYPDGTFKPGNTINYAEASKILVEAYGMTPSSDTGIWYEMYTNAIASAEAAIGLSPSSQLTRGQMAQLIFNLDWHMKMMSDDEMETGIEVGGALMVESKNIVENAMNANNVTTLVAAVQAADLVDTLTSSGPFTVFAPTDDAFAALPSGTVDTLLQTENKGDLANILTYHVVAGYYTSADLKDGMMLTTVQGGTIEIRMKEGVWYANDAEILIADVRSSNGVTFVIDTVLMPSDEEVMNDKTVYTAFDESVLTNGESKVLFFHAGWCPKCKAHDDALSDWYPSDAFAYSVYKLDYDSETELKQEYGVVQQHTFVLVDGNGNMVSSISYPSDSTLMDFLEG